MQKLEVVSICDVMQPYGRSNVQLEWANDITTADSVLHDASRGRHM